MGEGHKEPYLCLNADDNVVQTLEPERIVRILLYIHEPSHKLVNEWMNEQQSYYVRAQHNGNMYEERWNVFNSTSSTEECE